MKISFKFLIFCLIAAFLIVSYHAEVKAQVQAPTAGQSYTIGYLFNLINTNNPQKTSNFICMIPDPNQVQNMPNTSASISSYGANQFGFTSAWVEQNTNTVVTLKQDLVHVQRLINGGVLPSTTNLANLQGKAAYIYAQQLSNNFPKILLYFTAVSPYVYVTPNINKPKVKVNINPYAGKTFNLYITDPCPGSTNWNLIVRFSQPQYYMPAYTNVLSKWKVGN